MKLPSSLLLAALLFSGTSTYASAKDDTITYKHLTPHKQSIHVLKIPAAHYQLALVRALNSGLGRESVPSIAKRTEAIAAINAGFFQMGGAFDGKPAGVLKIANEWFSLTRLPRAAMGWSSKGNIIFDRLTTRATLILSGRKFEVHGVNKPAHGKQVVVYTTSFHPTTLTKPKRLEIAVNSHHRITAVHPHGNTVIPKDGYVVSFPASQKRLPVAKKLLKQKAKLSINITPHTHHHKAKTWQQAANIVGGAPLLIAEGKIIETHPAEKLPHRFEHRKHARTAFCTTADQHWIWVVADQQYQFNPFKVSFIELTKLLLKHGHSKKELEHMSLDDLKKLMRHEEDLIKYAGMTIPELATFMKAQGCEWAINLDGGGSSTMYYQDQVVNDPRGDEDEGDHQKMIRRVSDALVLYKSDT